MAGVIRFAAIDDDRMLLDGLRAWVTDVADLSLVAVAASVEGLLGSGYGAVDVVLLDPERPEHRTRPPAPVPA